METNDEQQKIIQRTLDEADVEADEVLAALVEVLVRDHLVARRKAQVKPGVINHPTTLWLVEKAIAERLHAQNGGRAGPIDPRLGSLMVLLVHCRERAEDLAEPQKNRPPDDEPPKMRLVRD